MHKIISDKFEVQNNLRFSKPCHVHMAISYVHWNANTSNYMHIRNDQYVAICKGKMCKWHLHMYMEQ